MYRLLEGLTIVEASSFVAGPSAGLYLAQMGAEVVRVDQIGGGPDFNRWPLGPSGKSLYWENLNRAKKSVALDLSSKAGRQVLQRLAASVGILVTNFPVRGFLAHDTIASLRPDQITVRVMGQADGGPALDYTVNAAVGIPGITGPTSAGDAPVNHVLPSWDLLTGAYTAFALMAALRHRDRTGEGQEVRIPLQDVAIGTVANLGMLAEAQLRGADRPRLGNSVYGAFGRDFTTRDGKRLMLLAITPRQWAGLVTVLDIAAEVAAIEAERRVSFASDESLRFLHADALYPLVEARIAACDYAPLAEGLAAQGCCFGPYRTMVEALDDPSLVAANPIFAPTSNASGLDYPAAGPFAALAADREPARPAPALGADTYEVLSALLSPAELDALTGDGVIGR